MPAVPPSEPYVENPRHKPNPRYAVALMDTTGTAGPFTPGPEAAYPIVHGQMPYDEARARTERYHFAAPVATNAEAPVEEAAPEAPEEVSLPPVEVVASVEAVGDAGSSEATSPTAGASGPVDEEPTQIPGDVSGGDGGQDQASQQPGPAPEVVATEAGVAATEPKPGRGRRRKDQEPPVAPEGAQGAPLAQGASDEPSTQPEAVQP